MKYLKITIKDLSDTNSMRPVTGGVPIECGKAPKGSVFFLKDNNGKKVSLQTSVLSRWADSSVKWILLDFQANGSQTFSLSWTTKTGNTPVPQQPVTLSRRNKNPLIQTGKISAEITEKAELILSKELEIILSIKNHKGQYCRGIIESSVAETIGKLRTSMILNGAFYTKEQKRVFGFRIRVTLFAGLSKIRLEPMILVDAEKGIIQKIRNLKLSIRPFSGISSGVIGGEPSWQGTINKERTVRLFQQDDSQYTFQGSRGKGNHAPGWAEFDNNGNMVAVAMSEFWQQWPKGISVNNREVSIELLPEFQKDTFKHMKPWYKYQYLFEGTSYRLRTGQTRRWEIWIDFNGNGRELSACANTPLIPAADPAAAILTGVWGDIAPAGNTSMHEYDKWADEQFEKYLNSIRKHRDYGEMNWGDWFGERHINWGNNEYDTSNIILSQFARTGDPKYFHVGHAAGRHTSEVDTIHFVNNDLKHYFESNFGNPNYPVRAGMMHEHCIGHVGGFTSIEQVRRLLVSIDTENENKRPYLCLDPYNLGHVFTQGITRLYFLTGDPWLKETVLTIGDNLSKLILDRKYNKFKNSSHSGRVNGWTMQALAPAFEISPLGRYRRAMKILADDALEEQDPHSGGWLYELPQSHCSCRTRKHVGEAGFIGSVRMNGLCLYYRLTGDKRIPNALKRYIDFLINDTWDERVSDWRYTSCPESKSVNQIGVTIMAMVHSARITGDTEHIRILLKAWKAKFDRLKDINYKPPYAGHSGEGKLYSMNMYGSGEAAALFAKNMLKIQEGKLN